MLLTRAVHGSLPVLGFITLPYLLVHSPQTPTSRVQALCRLFNHVRALQISLATKDLPTASDDLCVSGPLQ